jgi:4-hydroxy-4-methyl-2-oxoglutarate aldolase
MSKLLLILVFVVAPLSAQMEGFSRQQIIKYTPKNPYSRLADGRPNVPDDLINKLRRASSEMLWKPLWDRNYRFQWEGRWKINRPEIKLIGRAFTAEYMPVRPDVEEVIETDAAREGIPDRTHTRVIGMLQPGDVLVVDLFGKIEEGSMTGDNLSAAIYAATGNGFVVDGGIRDLDGVRKQPVPIYYREAHVKPLRNVMLTGINVPVQIGDVTVMPGDLIVGDAEGITVIPPHLVNDVVREVLLTELKDQWTQEKLATKRYKAGELYPTPKDPALIKEYKEWLARKKTELGLE